MTALKLAYAHLNLRWNPFGEISTEDFARLAVVQVEQYVHRLQHPGFALQYLGHPGRGKTTHLLALHRHFPRAPYFHFAENAPIPPIPHAPLLFLDETQRLPQKLRRQIFSRQASFVIATHVDHTREFERARLEHESVVLRGLQLSTLEHIIERRLEWARRAPGPVPRVPTSEMVNLIQVYGDDLSAILSRLYDEFRVLKEVSDVSIPAHKV